VSLLRWLSPVAVVVAIMAVRDCMNMWELRRSYNGCRAAVPMQHRHQQRNSVSHIGTRLALLGDGKSS
jgi:hypothetical protein